jgi:hypothetical protein
MTAACPGQVADGDDGQQVFQPREVRRVREEWKILRGGAMLALSGAGCDLGSGR